MKIDGRIDSTLDTLNQTEVALKKLSKLVAQDKLIKFFILAIFFVILLIMGIVLFTKYGSKSVVLTEYEYFFPNKSRLEIWNDLKITFPEEQITDGKNYQYYINQQLGIKNEPLKKPKQKLIERSFSGDYLILRKILI